MHRLVIVLPLAPLHTGDRFLVPNWPLHLTVLAPFQTDAAPADIAAVIRAGVVGVPALTLIAGQGARFGRRADIPVTLVEPTPALTALHRKVLDAVRPLAAAPNQPASSAFNPHITVKGHARVVTGEVLVLRQVALVDMAPRSAPNGRAVLATVELAAPEALGRP